MKIYISGGAKNGKSTIAQNEAVRLAAEKAVPLYYVATMVPSDDEDIARIERHRKEREGLGFETRERGKDISGLLGSCEEAEGVFLLDSVTALLANAMFPPNASEGEPWFKPNAAEEVAEDLEAFLSKVENAILVSDYIFADDGMDDGADLENMRAEDDAVDYSGTYMRGLAYIDRRISGLCDELWEVSAGIAVKHKM